jgi:hypothetical protein
MVRGIDVNGARDRRQWCAGSSSMVRDDDVMVGGVDVDGARRRRRLGLRRPIWVRLSFLGFDVGARMAACYNTSTGRALPVVGWNPRCSHRTLAGRRLAARACLCS